jgi:thymidine kinase
MKGRIEIITGPMFSGKSAHLIFKVSQVQAVGRKTQIFTPAQPTHTDVDEISSRVGLSLKASTIQETSQILEILDPEIEIIVLDEGHFFDDSIARVCSILAKQGKQVWVAGVDMDFRGEPFGSMAHLMAVADSVTKLTALCAICGLPACLTQRIVDGKPAKYTDPILVPGNMVIYEPRCRSHHEVD